MPVQCCCIRILSHVGTSLRVGWVHAWRCASLQKLHPASAPSQVSAEVPVEPGGLSRQGESGEGQGKVEWGGGGKFHEQVGLGRAMETKSGTEA